MKKKLMQVLSYAEAEYQLLIANEYVAEDELYIINIICLQDAREQFDMSKEIALEVSIRQLEEAISNHNKVICSRND